MKANSQVFAKNLRFFREKLGKNQAEISNMLGIDERRYSKWESGDTFPRMKILIQLTDLIGYTDIYRLITEDLTQIDHGMKIKVESTTKIVELNGVPARVWEGVTNTGIPVHCFITRIAVANDQPEEVMNQFSKELQECKAPSADIAAYPLSMIL